MSINENYMKQIADHNEITLSQEDLHRLNIYAETLVKWNQKMNLTGITEPDEIAVKHFLDSLLLLKAHQIPQGASLIDVGTGAGFPSIPCKIVRDDIKLTLLDSLNKRINFLKEVCSKTESEAKFVHARAEDGAHDAKLRAKFDFATARAVAQLRVLAEYCIPFVKVGGYFIALKGGECEQEIKEATNAIGTMGGKIEKVLHFNIEDYGNRSIIIIKKVKPTVKSFPRKPSQITKKPIM